VAVVLPAGAVGPLALVVGFRDGPLFRVGAALEADAVVGFAALYVTLVLRSPRSRVGHDGVLAGTFTGAARIVTAGEVLSLIGALLCASLLCGVFVQRAR
jgi:hypothetical protein